MPEPDRPSNDKSAEPNTGAARPDDSEIPDEDATDDAATSREARDEARRLDAVPYERVKKEEGE